MNSLQELLADFVRQFGSQTALGKAIGVSPSRLSRVITGEEHSLEVLNCLKLADVTGASPSVILKAAGKGDVAELIERLYGSARPAIEPSLSHADREHLGDWHRLSPRARQSIEVIMRDLLPEDAASERPAKKRKTA